jgi:hypothetical protein
MIDYESVLREAAPRQSTGRRHSSFAIADVGQSPEFWLQKSNIYLRKIPFVKVLIETFSHKIRPDYVIKPIDKLRIKKIKSIIDFMTKRDAQIRFFKKKGNQYLYGIEGRELVDFCTSKMYFSNRHEATGLLTIMVRYGYLISCELKQEFADNRTIW